MKKILLATVAVLAVSTVSAHAEIKLDLGGYFKGYAGYASQDADDLRSFDIKRKSQVYFEGETTLDNGLTVGYHGELFQENGTDGTALEESYLYFSGNWGRFNLGRSNNAAYLLQVSAPGADSNIDGQDISVSFYNPSDPGVFAATYHQDYKQTGFEDENGNSSSQYTDKITYLTPKFAGFQAGISYSPESDAKEVGDNTAGMTTDNGNGDREKAIDTGIRYDGEFSGVGVHVGGGYSQAELEANALPASNTYKEWNVGAKFTFAGFGLGAAYNEDDEGGASGDDDSVKDMTVGADYTWGAYVFGINYFNSDAKATLFGDNEAELSRYTAGANYTFGPGMQLRGAVAYYDEDLHGNTVPENDATVVTIGTDIQF